jgi:DNA-binding response OmpR family regulator
MMNKYSKLCDLSKDFHILYIEDDSEYRKNTYELLEHFFTKIDIAIDGEDGYTKYIEYSTTYHKYYDIVITDITMPKLNGLELTKKIYQQNEKQLVIVISAYDSSEYLLEFVNIGIEYFLVKPFKLEKLLEVLYDASLKLLYSREKIDTSTISKLSNNFSWDSQKLILLKNKIKVKLTKKEILLMQLFIENSHRAVSFEEIYDSLWGEDRHLASTHNLNPIISRLKKKLPDDVITNIYGFGYRFTL